MNDTYIKLDGIEYKIPSDCSFTRANAWLTDTRLSHDSSNTAQSITYLKKSGKQSQTFQISFNVFSNSYENVDLYDQLNKYERLIGKTIELYYAGLYFGRCIIENGSVGLAVDSISGLTTLSISYNLKETLIYTPVREIVSPILQ